MPNQNVNHNPNPAPVTIIIKREGSEDIIINAYQYIVMTSSDAERPGKPDQVSIGCDLLFADRATSWVDSIYGVEEESDPFDPPKMKRWTKGATGSGFADLNDLPMGTTIWVMQGQGWSGCITGVSPEHKELMNLHQNAKVPLIPSNCEGINFVVDYLPENEIEGGVSWPPLK